VPPALTRRLSWRRGPPGIGGMVGGQISTPSPARAGLATTSGSTGSPASCQQQ